MHLKDINIARVSILLKKMHTDMNPKQTFLVLCSQSLSCAIVMDYLLCWLGQDWRIKTTGKSVHCCDNLDWSAKFCKQAILHEQKKILNGTQLARDHQMCQSKTHSWAGKGMLSMFCCAFFFLLLSDTSHVLPHKSSECLSCTGFSCISVH